MSRTALTLSAIATLACAATAADSNIDPNLKFAWGENIGYINFADAGDPPGAQGVAVRKTFLSGYAWGENIGYINLGNGAAPYANTDNTNFGVNIDPLTGELSGFAWGENIGWINFSGGALASPPQPARLEAGRFRGYAWGENIGWINLDDDSLPILIQAPCLGDADLSGTIDLQDLNLILAQFGAPVLPGSGADFDGSGIIDLPDLNIVLATFGQSCDD